MQEPFMVPLWLFSCEAESSLREPPSIDVAMKLINNFHKNGFHTTGAPVLLRVQASIFFTTVYFSKKKNNTVIIQIQPPFISLQESSLPDRGAIPNGGLWFLKGAARIQTAMAVVVAFDSMSQEARVIKDYINVRVMILLGQFQWLSILFVKILIPWPWRFQCCSSPPFEQSSANTSGFPIDKRSCSMVGDWTIMFNFKFVELFVWHESSNKCDWLSMFYLVFWRTNE